MTVARARAVAAATRRGGPSGWLPLMALAYGVLNGRFAFAAEAAKAAEAAYAPPERTPPFLPLSFGTSTWSRLEAREGYDTLGVSRGRFQEGTLAAFRARLGVTSAPVSIGGEGTVRVHFAPQASGYFGTSGLGGTVGEAELGLYEGYFLLEAKGLALRVGRFSMNYGDAVVIGNLDWHQSARAFDGVHGRYAFADGYADLFVTSVAEGLPLVSTPPFAGDAYFWGAYAGFGRALSSALELELYLLGRSLPTSEGLVDPVTGVTYRREGATLLTQGVRAKVTVGVFDARTEVGVQAGDSPGAPTDALDFQAEARDTLAYQALLELGLRPVAPLRVAVGGAAASGDDPASARFEGYDDLYATGHKFLGWTDVIGARLNVLSANLTLVASITKSLEAAVVGHLFGRPQPGGLGRVGPDSFAGTEVDLQLKQRLGEYFSVRGAYSCFVPNAGHYPSGQAAHFGEVQAGVEF